jgi:hypothetical protein
MVDTKVQVRRAYEDPAQGDGTRVLVDRIWPSGLTKARRPLTSGARRSRRQRSCASGMATTRSASRNSAAATGRNGTSVNATQGGQGLWGAGYFVTHT